MIVEHIPFTRYIKNRKLPRTRRSGIITFRLSFESIYLNQRFISYLLLAKVQSSENIQITVVAHIWLSVLFILLDISVTCRYQLFYIRRRCFYTDSYHHSFLQPPSSYSFYSVSR